MTFKSTLNELVLLIIKNGFWYSYFWRNKKGDHSLAFKGQNDYQIAASVNNYRCTKMRTINLDLIFFSKCEELDRAFFRNYLVPGTILWKYRNFHKIPSSNLDADPCIGFYRLLLFIGILLIQVTMIEKFDFTSRIIDDKKK